MNPPVFLSEKRIRVAVQETPFDLFIAVDHPITLRADLMCAVLDVFKANIRAVNTVPHLLFFSKESMLYLRHFNHLTRFFSFIEHFLSDDFKAFPVHLFDVVVA